MDGSFQSINSKNGRKINPIPSVGLVNGLAVHGPNSGCVLEIEVTVIPAQR